MADPAPRSLADQFPPGNRDTLGLPQTGAFDEATMDLFSILRGALRQVPSEQRSGADRLRPPYPGPVAGANPFTADSARMLEVGHSRLPPEYQTALRKAPVMPLNVGPMPQGWNAAGLLYPGKPPLGGQPAMLGREPRYMTHELVHELARRTGEPWDKNTEEVLARLVAGDPAHPSGRTTRAMEDSAAAADAKIRKDNAPPPEPGLVEMMMGVLGRMIGR